MMTFAYALALAAWGAAEDKGTEIMMKYDDNDSVLELERSGTGNHRLEGIYISRTEFRREETDDPMNGFSQVPCKSSR